MDTTDVDCFADGALTLLDQLEDATYRLRWPTTRNPTDRKRGSISPITRGLVYERDGWHCCWCGNPDQLQLDHIVPWSAGGTHASSNLRTLCRGCNSARSNLRSDNPPPATPVTERCYWCSGARDLATRIAAYCGTCGTTSWVPHPAWLR